MKMLIVEPNFAAFLTAVYHLYYTNKDAETITSDIQMVSLMDSGVNVETDTILARKVRDGIIKKVGRRGYKAIADAYLSCDREKEQKILEYLKLLFVEGRRVETFFSDNRVIAFNDLIKKVYHEMHRMHGFIRFQELANGVFYSFFSGDNDVLELIIPHFKARFNDQAFVLHDIKRKKMAIYDGKKVETLVAPDTVNIDLSQNELVFSELWKEYFHNVNIENRKNTRVQNQYAPKKYRWFMNEF